MTRRRMPCSSVFPVWGNGRVRVPRDGSGEPVLGLDSARSLWRVRSGSWQSAEHRAIRSVRSSRALADGIVRLFHPSPGPLRLDALLFSGSRKRRPMPGFPIRWDRSLKPERYGLCETGLPVRLGEADSIRSNRRRVPQPDAEAGRERPRSVSRPQLEQGEHFGQFHQTFGFLAFVGRERNALVLFVEQPVEPVIDPRRKFQSGEAVGDFDFNCLWHTGNMSEWMPPFKPGGHGMEATR